MNTPRRCPRILRLLTHDCDELDAVPTTLFAHIYVTPAALQDILVVSNIAHLALEAPPRPVPVDALKTPRMFTLVVVLELRKYLADALQPLLRENVRWCVSLHNFFCALLDAVDIGCCTVAVLPIRTTYVAKFGATETPSKRSVEDCGEVSQRSRHVVTTTSKLYESVASLAGLPS